MREVACRPARIWLFAAACNGFTAVAMGAFAAHGLKASLPPEAIDWVRTGASYQMWHALALLGVSVAPAVATSKTLRFAGMAFLAGCILFSGSLYLMALSGWHGFAMATPLGGLAFLIGWAALAWAGLAWRPRA
jgi:uncharacterized membrane protein YgdD (TMEM256/DUF423 family)